MKFSFKKKWIHWIGIIAFLSIPVLLSPDFHLGVGLIFIKGFQRNFCQYFFLLLLFYINYYYLIPSYYFKKKYFLYCFAIAIFFILNVLVFSLFWNDAPKHIMNIPDKNHAPHFFDFAEIISFSFVVIISFLLRFNQRIEEIEYEKTKTELYFLKAQINPHFLFNTLNSIYALSLKKSDETPKAIIKIANLMRYILSENSNEKISLHKEIAYLEDYIALQKLRIDNTTAVIFSFQGNMDGILIAPMLLIPFIENAFKYGVNPEINTKIVITITLVNNQLVLIVKNKIVSTANQLTNTNIGIINTKKRLAHYYPNNHTLHIENTVDDYIVNLQIDL